MTPEQKHQIQCVKNRYHALNDGTYSREWVVATIRHEGWPEAAIRAALKEVGG